MNATARNTSFSDLFGATFNTFKSKYPLCLGLSFVLFVITFVIIFQPEDDDARGAESHAKYGRWFDYPKHITARERRQEALADEFAVVAEAMDEADGSDLDE